MIDDEYLRILMTIPTKINKCIDLLGEEYLSDAGLKPYYVQYILYINEHDGISQKDLNAVIPFDKSRISVVIHQLTDRGYVYNDSNGRNNSLHLTEKGKEVVPICKMFLDVMEKEIFNIDNYNPAQRQINIDLNERLDRLMERLHHE